MNILPPRSDKERYEGALELAIEQLRRGFDPERLAALGAELTEEGGMELACLCWRLAIRLDPFSMVLLPEGREVGVVWQILALDYLSGEPVGPPTRFLSFADFPEVRGYLRPFEARVTEALNRGVGRSEAEFVAAAERCLGTRGSGRPLSYLFRFFPRFEIQVVRHEGDEDFPPACNVLFPDNALRLLSAESLTVVGGKLVSALQGGDPCGRKGRERRQ